MLSMSYHKKKHNVSNTYSLKTSVYGISKRENLMCLL